MVGANTPLPPFSYRFAHYHYPYSTSSSSIQTSPLTRRLDTSQSIIPKDFVRVRKIRDHLSDGIENPPHSLPAQPSVASNMNHIHQRIHELPVGFSVRPIAICVRNIWDIKIHHPSSIHSITGFICYDYRGQLLEGRLFNNRESSEPRILVEGDEYELSGFSVIPNLRQMKLTQLPYLIRIDQHTTMLNVTTMGPLFPVNSFSPHSYRRLLALASVPTYLPDVVGQILLMQDLRPQTPESNKKVTIGLMLGKTKVARLTLWDNPASEFSTLQSKKDRNFKVVIVTSLIPRVHQGKLELTSSPATAFYFDRTIRHIKNYKGRIRRDRYA